ncbi:MAG: hypothetical protein Q9197_000394 [Variospora fuerteventurae]
MAARPGVSFPSVAGLLLGSTSKLPRDYTESLELTLCSTLFRQNAIFLTTVFAGAFAFEIYAIKL